MKYEIETTNIFDKWFAGIKDTKHRARIISRFDHIRLGNFGDHNAIAENLFELRFFFGPGYRAYYTIRDGNVVFFALRRRQVRPKQGYRQSKTNSDYTGVKSHESNHQKMGSKRVLGQSGNDTGVP